MHAEKVPRLHSVSFSFCSYTLIGSSASKSRAHFPVRPPTQRHECGQDSSPRQACPGAFTITVWHQT
jgi:hypothetical protein